MDLLRWILLGVGALIVIGVYVWSRRSARDEEGPFIRAEPGVGHEDDATDPLFATPSRPSRTPHQIPSLSTDTGEADLEAVHRELSSLQELLQSEADEPGRARPVADDDAMPVVEVEPRVTASRTRQEEKVVALYLVAPPQQVFAGADVGAALEEMGLIYSRDMHIYHRYPNGSGGGIPVFGVANLVEPGTLEIDALAATGTPGSPCSCNSPDRCGRWRPSICSPARRSAWPPAWAASCATRAAARSAARPWSICATTSSSTSCVCVCRRTHEPGGQGRPPHHRAAPAD
jgi:cell division protein ZipA